MNVYWFCYEAVGGGVNVGVVDEIAELRPAAAGLFHSVLTPFSSFSAL